MALSRRGQWRGSSTHGRGNFQPNGPKRSAQLQPRLPCRYFQRTGSCSYGSSCRFSHDQEQVGGTRVFQSDHDTETAEQLQERGEYNDWRRALRRSPNPNERHNIVTLQEIWSGAIGILEGGSRERQQMLVRDIVDDKYFGCEYLYATLKVKVQTHGNLALRIAEDFLKVITNPALLDCLSIDTYVGTMYNFISGANGERAVTFFTELCTGLLELHQQNAEECSLLRLEESLQAILNALVELLRREKRASFHDNFPKLFSCIEDISVVLDAADFASRYHVRRDRINVLRRMVDLSADLLATNAGDEPPSSNVPMTAIRSSYPIEIALPSAKHDNDHLDITHINILPTVGEISSSHPDFLPSTDFRQPHFHKDPIQRYLDTHFRLLRHDIFGPLKEVLSGLMFSFENGILPSQLPSGDMKAHIYQDASIPHVSVDDKRGFEAHICFSPPPHLRQKSPAERRRWWENSKRLEQGALICFVSSTGDQTIPLVLIVSEKCTDPSRNHSLVPESRQATITTKLATREPSDLQLLIQIYHAKLHGVLVDLPGLIPATFKPVLENLQEMMRGGELPFREWIIPDPTNTERYPARVAPPQYARGLGFSFGLDSIVQGGGASLLLSATASPDDMSLIDELEARTGLDSGQCQALVAALTREFALLQGPPGTGKSFLGVKLIKVLLGCKDKASLGPIIVM